MLSQYFELNYYASTQDEQHSLLGALWQLLHGASRTHGLPFDVSFPLWLEPVRDHQQNIVRPGSFGPVMRVFSSDPIQLVRLYQEVARHRLITSGLVNATPLREVPAGAAPQYAFVRSRVAERSSASYEARQARRAAEGASRGQNIPGKDITLNRLANRKSITNFVAMRSKENKQAFYLGVERIAAQQYWKKESNSYGLGGLTPGF